MLAGQLFNLLISRLEVIEKLIGEFNDVDSFLLSSLVKKKAFVQSVCRFAGLLTFIRDNEESFKELMQLEGSTHYSGNLPSVLVKELIRFRNDFTHYYFYVHHDKDERLLSECFELFKSNKIQTLKQKINDYKQSIDKEKEEDFEEHGKRPTNRSSQQPTNKTLEEYIASIKYIVFEANELKEINNAKDENETYISLAKYNCCQNILQMIEDTEAMSFDESVLNLVNETCENILNQQFPVLQVYFNHYMYTNDRTQLAHDYLEGAPKQIPEEIMDNCLQVGEFYQELVKQLEQHLKSNASQESRGKDSEIEEDEFGRKRLRGKKSSSDSESEEQAKPMHKKHKGDEETKSLFSSTHSMFHPSDASTPPSHANKEKLLDDQTETSSNTDEKDDEINTRSSPGWK